ncbi:WW/Rsp5/WWP domain protein [Cordyceps fumosorosea ARSEF 2679]|uniref:WW/Rsp5/WWP domain protein n=1 Tax=Cordyceps fumosorosea (strain ARSEF 2679) TaxID=1081104 RepID=A0A167MY14_CORFA|nr:WW/Rsp5/WWP domain protein [Cordyceps fumosorosea ARSEF 2679]OAA54888.1 WW/Rsp5/WWP domain protein [Cordyceps fumosorosea ARSEF 2679]
MTGPASPSTEGPTFAPPSLPPGWIAQWDSSSKKYYYVQLATGVSQWEIPTEAAKTGSTPAQHEDHPYGVPPPEIITHPDGSQTVKHADGRMEPIMADGSRGIGDGPSGDRGFGSIAMNALLGGKQSSGGGGSSALGSLANQFLGGSSGGGGKNSSGIGGKLVGQLASNLFSPSDKPEAPSNYHGGQTQNASTHQQGGLAGAVMGGVASMFGGQQGSSNQNFGYSNTGTGGTYSSSSPAPTYTPPGSNHSVPSNTNHGSGGGSNHGSQTTHGSASQSQSFSEKPSHQSSQYSDNSYSQQPPSSYGNQSHHSSQHSYGGGGGDQSNYSSKPSYNQSPSHGGDHSNYPSQAGYNQPSHGSQGHNYSGSHGGQHQGGQQYGGGQQHGGGYHSNNQYGSGQGQYGGGGNGGYQGQGQGYGGSRY